jgi:hypothetical protein
VIFRHAWLSSSVIVHALAMAIALMRSVDCVVRTKKVVRRLLVPWIAGMRRPLQPCRTHAEFMRRRMCGTRGAHDRVIAAAAAGCCEYDETEHQMSHVAPRTTECERPI